MAGISPYVLEYTYTNVNGSYLIEVNSLPCLIRETALPTKAWAVFLVLVKIITDS